MYKFNSRKSASCSFASGEDTQLNTSSITTKQSNGLLSYLRIHLYVHPHIRRRGWIQTRMLLHQLVAKSGAKGASISWTGYRSHWYLLILIRLTRAGLLACLPVFLLACLPLKPLAPMDAASNILKHLKLFSLCNRWTPFCAPTSCTHSTSYQRNSNFKAQLRTMRSW